MLISSCLHRTKYILVAGSKKQCAINTAQMDPSLDFVPERLINLTYVESVIWAAHLSTHFPCCMSPSKDAAWVGGEGAALMVKEKEM